MTENPPRDPTPYHRRSPLEHERDLDDPRYPPAEPAMTEPTLHEGFREAQDRKRRLLEQEPAMADPPDDPPLDTPEARIIQAIDTVSNIPRPPSQHDYHVGYMHGLRHALDAVRSMPESGNEQRPPERSEGRESPRP